MININKLIGILSNTKFGDITLPNNPKNLQINAILHKKKSIDNIISNNNSLNQTNITNVLTTNLDIFQKNNNQTNNSQSNNNYNSQSNNNVLEKLNDLEKQKLINSINYKIYFTNKENSKITLPELLLDIFKEYNNNKSNIYDFTKLDMNKLYMYGTKNPESYYKSILLLTKMDFITKNKYNMTQDILNIKKEMSFNIEDYYDMNNYKYINKKEYKKKELINNLLNKETYTDEGIYCLTSNYINHNIIIFDLKESKFYLALNMPIYSIDYADLLRMKDEKFLFLVNNNNCYLPVFYHNNNHLFDINLLEVLINNFEFDNKNYFNTEILKQKIEIYEMRKELKEQQNNYKTQNNTQSKSEYNNNYKDDLDNNNDVITINNTTSSNDSNTSNDSNNNINIGLNSKNKTAMEIFDDMFKNDKQLQKHMVNTNNRAAKQKERLKNQEKRKADEIKKLKNKNKKAENNSESNTKSDSNIETDSNTKNNKTQSHTKLELLDISKYKLLDLQNLANDYNIEIKIESTTGKMKNRTKQQLYDDLKKFC